MHRPYDLKDPNAFAVEVVGDSMDPVLKNKDIVICSPNKPWISGDHCVVKTEDGEVLIKRVHKSDRAHFTLSSDNPKHEPIVVPVEKVTGVFKIVWRKFN